MSAHRSGFLAVAVGSFLAACVGAQAAFTGFVGMTNGYFVDKSTGKPFVPHGVAYQTWNRPLGVWQTPEQLRYDLDEMVKMNCNAVRVDFVWQHAEEKGDNQWSWENYDLLVQECEKRDIRIFALIGYQWPPNWFPDSWYTMHPPEVDAEGIAHTNRWQSDIIGYETPAARAQYAEWIGTVCARYKNAKSIAGWIVGNESGYLGLWSGLLDGYDPYCEAAFRTWATTKYGTIANANATWGSSYASFTNVNFVDQYRAYGVEGAIWADMVQWREDSIASFTAVGARAAKVADTNHLISYSTVGMQWGEEDWRYHAEDRGKITAVCAASNAPIDFFSVNNYPWSMLGHESQNGQWGVSFTKKVAKVPVVYSETGFTSSETMWPGMNEVRQGPLIRNALWESLEAGAIGTHVFSWMDRPFITDREKGFGIVYADRGIKPAYWEIRNQYNLMEQVKIGDLLMGSQDPKPDIAFLWTDAVDSQYNRYECEMQQIAGALERIGYEPNFINLAELGAGSFTNYKVIVLPRNMRVEDVVPNSTNKTVLDYLRTVVIPKGVHVLASADLPSMQNVYGKPRAQFVNENQALFGIDASDTGGYEVPMRRKTYVNTETDKKIKVKFNGNALGPLAGNYTYQPFVWKYNDEITLSTGGVLWATMDSGRNKGFEDSTTNFGAWNKWEDTNTIANSTATVLTAQGFQYNGANVLQLRGDAGVWADAGVVPFGRYAASTYLRSATTNPLANGSYASIAIEWYGEGDKYLGCSESAQLTGSTVTNSWVKYAVTDFAPSNSFKMRRIIRAGQANLLVNPGLTGTGAAPTSWQNWNDTQHDPMADNYLGTSGNSWQFWYDGGIYQDITTGFSAGEKIRVGGWLHTPSQDAMRNGTKYGVIEAEFYNGAALISSSQVLPKIDATSEKDRWNKSEATLTVPAGATSIRVIVRCNDYTSGDGKFFADDLYVRNLSRAGGAVFVDNLQENPAMVVKNHGAGKAAIFLYSAGDNLPDTGDDADSEPDIQPWKYRYDLFASVIRDYFGVQPAITVLGTNNPYCLPEYRTTTNGAILIQLKNYLYDTALPNGGPWQTFVVQANMLTGKIIRAFDQGRIIEENCDGQFWISLPPDGQEMILAYNGTAPAPNPNFGSSDGRVWRGQNNRSGQVFSGPTNFPLSTIWTTAVSSGSGVVDGDRLFVANNYLTCLNALNGQILWQYSPTSAGLYGPFNPRGIACADGIVYAVTKVGIGGTGALFAIDQETGQLRWKFNTLSFSANPPVIRDGIIYFGSVEGRLRALSAQTGATIWDIQAEQGHQHYNGVALDGGYLYYVDGVFDGIVARSITNGDYLYEYGWGNSMEMTPSVVSGLVYSARESGQSSIRAFTSTGSGFPMFAYTNWNSFQRSFAVANNMMYFIGTTVTGSPSTYYVVAMNARTNTPAVWTYQLPGSVYYWSSPIVHSNKLYVSADRLYVFNATNGSCIWTSSISSTTLQEPCVKNGRVFLSDFNTTWCLSDGSAWPAPPAPSGNTNQVVQISDSPAVVHPFGDKVYTLKVKYDCRDVTGLKLYCAFMENGNNGDTLTNEIYQILTNSVIGNGEQWYYMWIPDPNPTDTDYKSTPDGGKYVFQAWLANTSGVKVATAVPQPTILEWGVRVTNALPANLTKGQAVTMNTEWEEAYEQLYWQNTPMARNDAYAGRVAVYRSNKTEAQFPGHLSKVNEVCNWLESLGYQAANPLDIAFDNVTVAGLFSDDFNDGNYTGWTRVAGANNWTVEPRHKKCQPGNNLEYNTSGTFALNATARQLDFCFEADSSRYLDKVDVLVAKVGGGTAPIYSMSVFADSNGVRSGTSLATASLQALSTTYNWRTIDMPEIPLEIGKKYHLVMAYQSGALSTTNYMAAYMIGPWTTNAPGRVNYSTTSGSTWITNYTYVPVFLVTYADTGKYGQTYNSVSSVGSLNNTRYGQKFTLAAPMTATNLQLYIRKSITNMSGNAQVRIRRWSDKATLATSTVSAASISTANAWVNFPFVPNVTLGQSTQYFYEVFNLGTNGYYYSLRANAATGVYGQTSWHGTNDHGIYTTTAGTTYVAEVNYDLEFRLQGAGTSGQDLALRASRIGNDENYLSAGTPTWSNVTVSADIKYNKQDYYFSDAELLLRYVDRNNYYKVGIRNFYGFWRLKFTVKVNGYSQQTGWLYEFPKTNRPADGVWYNLKVDSQSNTNRVYFNGTQVGVFYATNFPTGKIALGSKASQLGIWEPSKGYFFIDDDENGYSTDPYANGAALNLDWGYLNQFYRTLVLPSVYVMNDTEASNMVRWVKLGYNNIIATDGGIAQRNEAGAADLGRVESCFGVQPVVGSQASISKVIVGTNDHYVTMDYVAGSVITASGSGKPWTTLSTGSVALATISNGTASIGFIANTLRDNPAAPSKTFVFNYGIDASGQLTNGMKKVAQRAFEWARGQANKVRVELKYSVNPTNPALDLAVYTTNVWVLGGTGQTNVIVNVPSDGLMTGDAKFYWAVYTYPWDATNAWTEHNGFYSSGNDGSTYMSIAGKGLQILGATADAYAGRDWDVWAAYNTRTTAVTVTFGIKERGSLQSEDNFDDGNYTGWTRSTGTVPYVAVTVTNGALQATNISPYAAYTTITRDGLNIAARNITIEYDVLFTNGANEGGIIYRDAYLNVNPSAVGWQDVSPVMYTTNRPVSNKWCHVVVNIRDGSPNLLSDVYVDGRPAFVSEPLNYSSFAASPSNLGFTAIFLNLGGAVRWENVRVADEQYSLVWTNVMGEFVPNNPTNPTFWPAIPDYDPEMWEHDGSTYGAQYDWYVYVRGENLHSYLGTRVYFSPRLQVELASFPTNLSANTNIVVPVEWEQLPASNLPARLRVRLFEAYSGIIYVEKTVTVSTVTGSTNIAATIPTMPPGSNYVWSAFIYPTNAIDPWIERFGSDDTFRFNDVGIGLEPETMVNMIGAPVTNNSFTIYSDAGTPPGSAIYTWGVSGGFNGNYVDATAPEGTMTFYCNAPLSYAGWGTFLQTNLSAYANGYIKFWSKSSTTLKMDLETNPYAKKTVYIPSSTNAWRLNSIAVTNFSQGAGALNLTNMYGLFEITVETPSTFYIDDVKWSMTP